MSGKAFCAAIVFCDYVIVDAQSGKNSLIGTFPGLQAAAFPHTILQFFVHVALSNFTPEAKQTTVLVNIKNKDSIIGTVAVPVNIPAEYLKNKPLNLNLNMAFSGVKFDNPGEYECEVLKDGEKIGSRILFLELAETAPVTKK